MIDVKKLLAKILDRGVFKDNNGKITVSGETVTGDTYLNNAFIDGYLTLRTNNRAISFKDADGYTRSMIYIQGDNHFGLGYGMYNDGVGETRIYGDTIRMYSHNPVVINQDVQAPRFVVPNDYGFRGTASGGATVPIIGMNSNNSIWVGNSGYPLLLVGNNIGMTTSGDLTIQGDFKIGGHSTPVGYIAQGARTSTAGTVGTTYSTVASITLSTGRWIIIGFNSFNGGTAGTRKINVTSDSTSTADAAVGSSSTSAAANAQVVVRSEICVNITASEATYYLRAKSQSQVDSPYGNLSAIRIA